MTKKELSQLYWLSREVEQDRKHLEELRAVANGGSAKITGMPRMAGSGRSLEECALLIAETEQLIDGKLRLALIEYNRINRYIAEVDDSFIRQILFLRYVRWLGWAQVAKELGGGNTADGVRMLHNRFLQMH